MSTVKFQEEYSAKIPALVLLSNLGYQYLSPAQALAFRSNNNTNVVLTDILKSNLQKRQFTFKGVMHSLSHAALDKLVQEIQNPPLNEGLTIANERFYDQLMFGISVTEFINGQKVNPTIQLIDWQHPEYNDFHVTEELKVACIDGVNHRIPDIVLYVNGLPLAVIEAKRPDGHKDMIDQAISQMQRNQRIKEIPHLFAFTQLLLAVDGHNGRYGTVGTPNKFWANWREEVIQEPEFHAIKNKTSPTKIVNALFADRKAADRQWFDSWLSGGLVPTGQDKLLVSLCRPDRLLEMIRYYTFTDSKNGKIVARYQQVFGIKALLARITQKDATGARKGGVIWHTTGSGKSFTMVLLSKALIFQEALKSCRVVVITDRTDLEAQLSKTFASSGAISDLDQSDAMATSGKRLAEQIGKGNERIIFSLIQKFNSATKLPECHNDSSDLIVLVDEGHRSQGGENHIRMRQALPNASFVAFTGTPLLQDDKTQNKFGPIVHAYTMQRAVEDGAVTPLLYEERRLDLDINDRAIDSWFERITAKLNANQKADLKRKFAKKGELYKAEGRLELIAHDISDHYSKNIIKGLKGQVACDSRISAIRLKGYLDKIGLVTSALVMSSPDSREGNTSADESHKSEIQAWWDENVGKEDAGVYKQRIIDQFANDDDLHLLIVIDQLLTGFDEPKNAVLYIDKNLKQHNLIQAIARVNRLHKDKKFGLLIDYRGILGELDTTIAQYQDLATRTQGGYSIDDIEGLYHAMSTEYKKLPNLYDQLWGFFTVVKNKQDIEQLLAVLIPKMEEVNGQMVDRNQKLREDFYQVLSEFAVALKVALQSAAFFEDKSFSDADRSNYKRTLKELSALRQMLKQITGETVDYDEYAAQVKQLIDKHVVGVGVKESDGVYDVTEMGKTQPDQWNDDKTRNEKDIIQTRVTKEIDQLLDDPYAKAAFSELLRQVIAEADALFDNPMKQYLLFKEFEDKVRSREVPDMPDAFNGNLHAQAYFGVFKLVLGDVFAVIAEQGNESQLEKWVELAFKVDSVVLNAVAEYSINPQNIETEIRKQLLPLFFAQSKGVGLGIDQAKAMVEHVVQICRAGAAK